jgi:Mg-chelatase subunit ChlD
MSTAAPAGAPASRDAAPAAESAHPAPAAGGGAASRPLRDHSNQYEAVTAGVTDDNEEWNDYLAYLNRHQGEFYVHERDVSERYLIQVMDEGAAPIHDAQVEIYAGEQLFFNGRTDAGGQMLFHPRALDEQSRQRRVREFRVVARKGYVAHSQIFARTGGDRWVLSLSEPPQPATTQLDLLFLIDATGSMGDEIDKLKASMADVADQIAGLPEQPDVQYGLVAYRDQGDAFVVRTHDFTYDLRDFQRNLAALRADGGGDTPEALNQALHRSLFDLSWRAEDTVRLVILVADAPPHLDYGWEPFNYATDMIEAVRQGVKIFPVGASNLEADGEYIFRQLAQFTGGKFVFLTYEEGSDPSSGPGTETEHEVDNYSVDTLDRLVVRLVRDELAKLSGVVSGSSALVAQQQPSPMPTPTPQPQAVTCTFELASAWDDCHPLVGLRVVEQGYDQLLLHLTLDPHTTGYSKVRFDITYGDRPSGASFHLGDSASNNGYGGDDGLQSNDAELVILDDALDLYGNDHTPSADALDGARLLWSLEDVVRSGETIALEVSDQRLGVNHAGGIDVVESPHLFALNRQPDRTGLVNYDLYAAFNRTIANGETGYGVSQVVVTLYPAR